MSDAIAIFRLNTTEHPLSSNAFDSLGEAFRVNGENELAINSYRTAVKLDPTNAHAAAMLKDLHWDVVNWIKLLLIAIAGLGIVGFGRKWVRKTRVRKG